MERLINIETFFVIKCADLDVLINSLGLAINKTSDIYLLTLILCNIFAYLVIYLFIKLAIKITKILFKKRRFNKWL